MNVDIEDLQQRTLAARTAAAEVLVNKVHERFQRLTDEEIQYGAFFIQLRESDVVLVAAVARALQDFPISVECVGNYGARHLRVKWT